MKWKSYELISVGGGEFMFGYITENLPIEEAQCEDAVTIGKYESDELQTIKVRYCNSSCEQVLYHARPSCAHRIQAQWSGIKCVVCQGWYCA